MHRVDDLDGKGRHYEHPVTGHKMPSVTNVLQVLAKPALIPWAANVERELVVDTAAKLYESIAQAPRNGDEPCGDFLMFREALLDALPKKKAHKLTLETASDIGTEAHSLIEWRIKKELGIDCGEEPTISEPALWAVAAFEDWRREVKLKASHSELRLWSDQLDAAGSTDAICCELEGYRLGVLKRIKAIADWKSSKAIWPEMEIQIAAYWYMAIERGVIDDTSWGLILRLPKTLKDPKFEARLVPPSRCKQLVEVFRACRRIWQWQFADKETRKP